MGKILFDINNQVDVPNLILQSKSGTTIGGITGFTDLTYKNSLNSANELSLNVYKYLDGEINPLWEEITDLKTIYIPEFAEKFEIEISYTDEEMETKSITGTALCEAELSQIIIRGLEINTEDDMKYSSTSTYQITKFYDEADTEHSLLHRVLKPKASHYTIAHVDDTLCDLAFEFTADGTDIYSFLTGEVAEKCECLFVFDSMTRTISVYDLCSTCQNCYENEIGSMSQKHYRGDFIDVCPNCGSTNIINGYGEDTTILIDKENLANSITKESDVGSLKNCLYVEGGDDTINAAFILSNPNGSQYIYYFSPETLEDMGEPLSTAISEYNEKYDEYKSSHTVSANNIDYCHKYSEAEDKMVLNNDKYVNGVEKFDFDYIDDYNNIITEILNLSTDNNFQNFSNNYHWGYTFTGQNELVKELYNAMDLEDFIQTSMMPEYSMGEYDKYTALSLLTNSNFGTLAIPNLDSLTTNTTVTNVIEAKAKTLIDTSRYKVSVFDGSFSYDESTTTATWNGTFQIVDRLDDDDTTNTINNLNYLDIATNVEKLSSDKLAEIKSLNISEKATLYINDDFVEYTKNSIESVISKADLPTSTNICSPTVSYAYFCKEIKKYSIDNLKIFYNTIQSCCDVLQSKMDDVTDKNSELYQELNSIFSEYKGKLSSINTTIATKEDYLLSVKKYRALMSAYIKEVAEELNFQSFLENYSTTENLWEIFNYYRREDTYKNDNIISDNLETNAEIVEYAGWLMTYAKKELLKMGTPQYTISTSLNNLLALPEFESIIEDFEVGNWIHVRTDVRDDIAEELIYKMRLLSYQINFDDIQSIDVEFSNVTRTIDCMSDVKSVLDSAQSIASSYNSVYKDVDKSKEAVEIVSKWVNESLDLTNQMIKSEGNDQSIIIDEHGILARKYDDLTSEYDKCQLKIFSNGLYFTNDNWNSIKTGVGKFVYKDPKKNFAETIGYGVIADTIVSNIVCTNELGIYNESGSVKIDGDGITLDGGSITWTNPISKSSVDGLEDLIEVLGYDGTKIEGTYIYSPKIYGGELIIGDESSGTYAKITEDGVLYAKGGVFSGEINAWSGTIGGWHINRNNIINEKQIIDEGIAITEYFELNANNGIDIVDVNNNKRTIISTNGYIRQVGGNGLIEITDGGIGFYNANLTYEIEIEETVVGGTGGGTATGVVLDDFDLSKQYMSIFPSSFSSNDSSKGMIFQANTEADFVSFTKNHGDGSGQVHKVVMDFSDDARFLLNVYGTAHIVDNTTIDGDLTLSFGKLKMHGGYSTYATLSIDNYGRLVCDKEVVATVVGTHLGSVYLPNFWSGNTTYSNRVKMLVSSGGDIARLGVVTDTWIGQGIKWNVHGNLTIDGYTTSSDERLKNSFESMEQFNDVFMSLNPTTFRYNNDLSNKVHFGFKAQNIEEILNSHGFNADDYFILSKTKKNKLSEDYNGYDVELGLSYQEFTAWNTHMIQKCITENNELKAKIQELCDKIQKLEETA